MPALTLLFGILLTYNGVWAALRGNYTDYILENGALIGMMYPGFLIGVLVTIVGAFTAVSGYLLFHGKIRLV